MDHSPPHCYAYGACLQIARKQRKYLTLSKWTKHLFFAHIRTARFIIMLLHYVTDLYLILKLLIQSVSPFQTILVRDTFSCTVCEFVFSTTSVYTKHITSNLSRVKSDGTSDVNARCRQLTVPSDHRSRHPNAFNHGYRDIVINGLQIYGNVILVVDSSRLPWTRRVPYCLIQRYD
jgi:hypothetical protein